MRLVMLLIVGLVLGGAARAAAGVEFAVTPLEVVTQSGRRHPFTVEMAVSAQQLAQGLMYRTQLPERGGMLFDFGRPQPVSMWMKNTRIPLDMVFIAVDGRIVGIAERTTPMSTDVISAPEPVRAVLELRGGTAERLGIVAGDRVVHPIFKH
jgi:uncharacterized protein